MRPFHAWRRPTNARAHLQGVQSVRAQRAHRCALGRRSASLGLGERVPPMAVLDLVR